MITLEKTAVVNGKNVIIKAVLKVGLKVDQDLIKMINKGLGIQDFQITEYNGFQNNIGPPDYQPNYNRNYNPNYNQNFNQNFVQHVKFDEVKQESSDQKEMTYNGRKG